MPGGMVRESLLLLTNTVHYCFNDHGTLLLYDCGTIPLVHYYYDYGTLRYITAMTMVHYCYDYGTLW